MHNNLLPLHYINMRQSEQNVQHIILHNLIRCEM